jgi:Fic family protein
VTDPQRQALFEFEPLYPDSPADPNHALREVFNYRRALRWMQEDRGGLPISLRLIRELHAILMDGVRGSDKRPGEFRAMQVQIGRPARFVPPPPQLLLETLDRFEEYLHAETTFDPLVNAFLVHYQFEAIHPFADGNGRIGRLLLALTAAQWCRLSSNWLYMSPFFEKHKLEYMDRLLAVSTHGEWEHWIRFCLEGVVVQATDAERRCDRLLATHRDLHARLRGGSVRLSALVDDLFRSPVVTVKAVQRRFGTTYPTARSDLKRLQRLGIVEPLREMELITYYCPAIYRITYDDNP